MRDLTPLMRPASIAIVGASQRMNRATRVIANVLFQVVNDRYLHHRSMIFTTNKPLAAWGRACCTTQISRKPSSTASSNAAGTSNCAGAPTGRATRRLTSNPPQSHHQRDQPEFPEITCQNFRNPHLDLHRPLHRGRDVELPHPLG